MGWCVSAEAARERIGAALDAIDAAHAVLRETSSDVVGNVFRVEVAERLETQERANRGLMYRVFAEIAEPPDGSECLPAERGMLCARLRVPPNEIVRRFKLAARIRARRSLSGAPVSPQLPELAAAVQAGALGPYPRGVPTDRRLARLPVAGRGGRRRAHPGAACHQA